MTPVHEDYKDYVAPKRARRVVERLLSTLPEGHLAGLEAVVLTNSARMGKGKTKRIKGRKYPEAQCLGFYHPATQQKGPWIQIVVDNIAAHMPPFFWRSKFLSDMIFAGTVYHEVGHHLDATIGSPSRTGEAAADEWSRRLRLRHFAARYPILMRLLHFVLKRLPSRIDEEARKIDREIRREARQRS